MNVLQLSGCVWAVPPLKFIQAEWLRNIATVMDHAADHIDERGARGAAGLGFFPVCDPG